MERTLIADWYRGHLGNIQFGLAILSLASGIFSFMGFTVEAKSFAELALGGVFALASGAGIYMAWDHIIKIVPF